MDIWTGVAKPLEDTDLPRIAHEIGVSEDVLHAFMDVEAAGSGFDSKGRLKCLFEPHIFFRELINPDQRAAAVKKGLAYPKWKPGAYPKDSYPRLIEAVKINRTAAFRSCSWGLGQIMGFNHLAAGYGTVDEMIRAFAADEDNQVEAMVRFIKAKKLDDDLRRQDWEAIEKGYNGGGYGGAYAKKMRARFAWWQKKPDTPWSPTEKYKGEDEPEAKGQPVPPDQPPKPPGASIAAVVLGALLALLAAGGAFVSGLFGGN